MPVGQHRQQPPMLCLIVMFPRRDLFTVLGVPRLPSHEAVARKDACHVLSGAVLSSQHFRQFRQARPAICLAFHSGGFRASGSVIDLANVLHLVRKPVTLPWPGWPVVWGFILDERLSSLHVSSVRAVQFVHLQTAFNFQRAGARAGSRHFDHRVQ